MKPFDHRNHLKKKIHSIEPKTNPHERDIRYAYVGCNIGSEQDGKGITFTRPVLVIKEVGSLLWVAPLTKRGKGNRFYFTLPRHYFNETSRIILSQVRIVDRKRFTHKITKVHIEDFHRIQKKLKTLLF